VLTGAWGAVEVQLPLIGEHNLSNTLQAVALASTVKDLSRGLSASLGQCPQVPGRLQRVSVPGGERGPSVLVDYAHTHDALANVLSALRPVTPGKLAVLIGCGGDRDATKRPKMAQVAAELADRVWLTSDNPRTEDPDAIIQQMLAGVPSQAINRVTAITDRSQAIAACIAASDASDTVLLAGKGHETYQVIADPASDAGTRKIPFDDVAQATYALTRWLAQDTRQGGASA